MRIHQNAWQVKMYEGGILCLKDFVIAQFGAKKSPFWYAQDGGNAYILLLIFAKAGQFASLKYIYAVMPL